MTSFLRPLTIGVLLAALLIGCVPTDGQVSAPRDETVIVVLGTPPSTLIPYSANVAARQVGSLVFQSLVSLDASGMPRPDLALALPTYKNGGVSADGKTMTFQLNPKARWHDGNPVTASDVVYTCGLLQSGRLPTSAPATWRRLRAVKAVDDATVSMEFSEPDIPGALMLVPFVLPEHLLGDTNDLVSDSYWDKPIGSGTFRVDSAVRRRSVLLNRVDDRQGADVIRCVFHEDTAAMRTTWDASRRAVWPNSPLDPIGSERVAAGSSALSRYYLFNCSEENLTADVNIRRAAASMIVAASGEMTGTVFGARAIRHLRAEQVPAALDEMGWSIGADNVRQRAGRALMLEVPYLPESEADGRHMDSVASALKGVGIGFSGQARIIYGDYYDPGATLLWGKWDVARIVAPQGSPNGYGWPFEADDEPSFENPGGLNVAHLRDSQLETLLARMRATDDARRLTELKAEFGRRLEDLAVIVPDETIPARTLYRGLDGVAGYAFEPDAIRGAAEWVVPGSDGGQVNR